MNLSQQTGCECSGCDWSPLLCAGGQIELVSHHPRKTDCPFPCKLNGLLNKVSLNPFGLGWCMTEFWMDHAAGGRWSSGSVSGKFPVELPPISYNGHFGVRASERCGADLTEHQRARLIAAGSPWPSRSVAGVEGVGGNPRPRLLRFCDRRRDRERPEQGQYLRAAAAGAKQNSGRSTAHCCPCRSTTLPSVHRAESKKLCAIS